MWFKILQIFATVVLLCRRVDAGPRSGNTPNRSDGDGLRLRILHTNDMHARFVQTSRLSAICSDAEAAEGKCYGGFARLATAIQEARNDSTPAIFLIAGDTYQGSVLYTTYKWEIVSWMLKLLKPNASSLGNHEFDDGVAGLIPFINASSFPILATNLNLTGEPDLAATPLANSTILTVNGTQVGVIGYLTPETKNLSSIGNVVINDEIPSIREEAARLKNQGVRIIIALGHSGFETDKKIAQEVEDVDLVIGGHTNTFLYNGNQPDLEVPQGLYPTPVIQSSGRTVYVVQAYAFTKYLGNLTVEFDSNGEITSILGTPILLDSKVEQDTKVLKFVDEYNGRVARLTTTIIGKTRVLLNGDSLNCRRQECNMGNLLADAIVDYNVRRYTVSSGWTDAAIAIVNSGSIRSSITTANENQISYADVMEVLPFESVLYKVPMTGAQLLTVLEHSVSTLTQDTTTDFAGAFLQVSGIEVTYDISQPTGSKVESVRVRCANCTIPIYDTLNENETYTVLLTSYMHEGGDGYTMLSELPYTNLNVNSTTILVDYLQLRSPVYPGVDWRITIHTVQTTSSASLSSYSLMVVFLSLLIKFSLT